MKKIVFAIALMAASITSAFAGDNKVSETENVEAYDMTSINVRSLGSYVGMSQDQYEIAVDVMKEFGNDMIFASTNPKGESRDAVTRNAVMKNMRNMRMFLDNEQYKRYVTVLNATLNNRGIKF